MSRPTPKGAAGRRGINPKASPWSRPGSACAEHIHRTSPGPGERTRSGEDQPPGTRLKGATAAARHPPASMARPKARPRFRSGPAPASAPSQRAPGRSPSPMISDTRAPFALVADVPAWKDPVPGSFTMRCPARRQQPEEGREARAAMMILASPASPMASGPARCRSGSGRSSARRNGSESCSASGQRSPTRPGTATLP